MPSNKIDLNNQVANRYYKSSSIDSTKEKIISMNPIPVRVKAPLFIHKTPHWKRIMDIVVSLLGIFFLLPLLLLITIFIKIVSPGPIFFKQNRVGYGEKVFSMLKFRTMKHNTDTSEHREYLSELIKSDENDGNPGTPMTKIVNDSQIIPLGNILRFSGLDELPQLFNVLLGDMSLIGPRPAIPYEVEEYKYWFCDRFDTLPGITGLWQVSGKNRLTFKEMVRLDVRYSRTQSFWLDIKILLLTPRTIFLQLKDGLFDDFHKEIETNV